ncbi:MAG: hypothetical protein ACYC5F_00250 [Thermoleophilia bacterium]
MFANVRKIRLSLLFSLFVSLLGMALVAAVALTTQGSASASSIEYTATTPDPSSPLPVKEFEVDRHYNYHIPSDDEVVANKQKLMNEDKFKEKAKREGQQKAENELDARIKADINDMKEKNQLGSEKIPMLEIGEHSAYVSKYTYSLNTAFQCSDQTEDPVNLFFYDTGWTQKVITKLYSAGWEESPFQEENQCAYASSTQPFYIEGLRQNTSHMIKGLDERDHMRMWEGGLGGGSEGWWSIGSAHHEAIDWSLPPTHCLIPHVPDGSSFDLAEYHVWNDALGYYPRFFFNAYNAFTKNSCGYDVYNDGISVGVHITSNTLGPGEFLAPGMARYSPDMRFAFTYQTDGNLVLYQVVGGGWYPIWHINRFTSSPGNTVMQSDGNLVVHDSSGYPYWYSRTWGHSVIGLFVQNDGNVVIYNTNWVPIWATNTCCR